MVDLPATNHKTHTYITCPAHANSAIVCTGPSTTDGTELQIPMFQPLAVHNHATRTLNNQEPSHGDTRTPGSAFMPAGHQPIQPRFYEEGGRLPIRNRVLLLNPRDVSPDPWCPEFAHAYPWSVRLAALEGILDDLEPLLDVQNNTYV